MGRRGRKARPACLPGYAPEFVAVPAEVIFGDLPRVVAHTYEKILAYAWPNEYQFTPANTITGHALVLRRERTILSRHLDYLERQRPPYLRIETAVKSKELVIIFPLRRPELDTTEADFGDGRAKMHAWRAKMHGTCAKMHTPDFQKEEKSGGTSENGGENVGDNFFGDAQSRGERTTTTTLLEDLRAQPCFLTPGSVDNLEVIIGLLKREQVIDLEDGVLANRVARLVQYAPEVETWAQATELAKRRDPKCGLALVEKLILDYVETGEMSWREKGRELTLSRAWNKKAHPGNAVKVGRGIGE